MILNGFMSVCTKPIWRPTQMRTLKIHETHFNLCNRANVMPHTRAKHFTCFCYIIGINYTRYSEIHILIMLPWFCRPSFDYCSMAGWRCWRRHCRLQAAVMKLFRFVFMRLGRPCSPRVAVPRCATI